MTEAAPTLKIHYTPHSDLTREIHAHPARFRVVDCGRRFGKTVLGAVEAFEMCRDIRRKYNRKARGWWVAPTYKLAQEGRRIMEQVLVEVIAIDRGKLAINDERCIFFDGSEVEFRSTDGKDERARGAGLDFAILDEDARNKADAWEFGIRPALSDKQGRALFLSTPKGRNHFFDKFVLGQLSENDKQWKSWKAPTYLNPYFPKEEWDDLKRNTPQHIFQQEFEAEFLEDSAAVFRKISQCVDGILEPPAFGHEYVMGVDLAKVNDFTVITVVDISTRPVKVVSFERFNQIDWTLQKEKIRYTAQQYNNARVYMDSTGLGDPIVVDLQRAGVTVFGINFSNEAKAAMVERGIVFIERHLITFPKIDELINELMAYEYEILPSRRIRYQAPEGLFDDCVSSFILSLYPLQNLIYESAPAIQPKPASLENLPKEERQKVTYLQESIRQTNVAAMGGQDSFWEAV